MADYPFTTLYPCLGVVSVSNFRSFVVADLPGLIEGAAEGAGLGIRFLKHVARTRLLFHVVDIAPMDESDPIENVETITEELAKYGHDLLEKERWLVLNKVDVLPQEEAEKLCKSIVKKLRWKGRVFIISGLARQGLDELAQEAMRYLEEVKGIE